MLEPLKWYINEDDFRFYLIDCGAGLMHLIIFPDKTVMLFDCNVTKEKEKEILDFLDKHIPSKKDPYLNAETKDIDIFVNSHRDEDHYRGLKEINEKFKIKSIWDSGQSGENTDSSEYNYYMYLRRELKKKSDNNLVVPIPSNAIFKSIGNVDIYCLAAEADFEYKENERKIEYSSKIQHTNSMVLLMIYKGRKLLLTGDSDWISWKEQIVKNFSGIVPNYENTDILVASHHGSRSFFTDEETIDEEKYPDTTYIESIELINPIITLISCANYEYKNYHLPNKEAMELYKKHTAHGKMQIHTTYEKGNLCGYIDKWGNFGVIPDRFKNTIPLYNRRVDLFGFIEKEGELEKIEIGDKIRIGTKLKFILKDVGNILESRKRYIVSWEVSNNGIREDYNHKEIYEKGENEQEDVFTFRREVAYRGKHLLRCSIKDYPNSFEGTMVFWIEGV